MEAFLKAGAFGMSYPYTVLCYPTTVTNQHACAFSMSVVLYGLAAHALGSNTEGFSV